MENYTSKNIQYLDGIEHIRLRPSMYIGDIGINGLHGVYCYLIARIFINGKIYEQIYSKGIPITKLKKLDQQNKKQMRGTEITLKVDKSFFVKKIFDYNLILKRIKELSSLNKGLLLILIDKRFYQNKKEFCYSNKGIKEFILNLSKDKNYLKKFFYLKKFN
ncbi:MAG: hypothetical protein ACKA33_01065 [Candidatus Karelsulcia muelleri]